MDAKLPAGARDLASLMSLGPLRRIGSLELEAACRVTVNGADSIWIDLGYPVTRAAIDYTALWKLVHPAPLPTGYDVRPVMTAEQARAAEARFVRLALVSIHSPSPADGAYVLTGVRHSAQDTS